MTDHPIIFSAPMVQALLAGTKTMTRRLASSPLRKAQAGDRLWVRETWQLHSRASDVGTVVYRASINGSWTNAHELFPDAAFAGKKLQPKPFQLGWRSPLHLFRDLSRLTLEVTATKVERLRDISPQDAWDEGVERRSRQVRQMWLFGASAQEREDIYKRACVWEFEELWKRLHGGESWDENPEVVAISFSVSRANINSHKPLSASQLPEGS